MLTSASRLNLSGGRVFERRLVIFRREDRPGCKKMPIVEWTNPLLQNGRGWSVFDGVGENIANRQVYPARQANRMHVATGPRRLGAPSAGNATRTWPAV